MNYEQRTKQWGEGRGEGALDTSNEQLATSDEFLFTIPQILKHLLGFLFSYPGNLL